MAPNSATDTSLDTILSHLGDLGKYQLRTFSLICIVVVLHSAVHVAFVFTAKDLDYRCEVPGCDENEFSTYQTNWMKYAIPYKNELPEKCKMYHHISGNASCSTYSDFNRSETLTCSKFIFATEEKSIVQEYDIYCDDNLWKLTLVGTMNNIGQFFGLFLSGLISDRFGRKMVLVWGMVLCGICGIIKTFMPTYELFLLLEFLDAAFGAGTYICGFILGVELVGPRKRILTGTLASSCYALGELFAAGSAWLVQSWKPFVYITYGPTLLLIALIWLVPESIRWNLSKGHIKEAKETLRTCAKVNGKTISEDALEKLTMVEYDELQKIKNPWKEVFKSTALLLRLINCCFCWITCAFLFYGLTLNSVALAGNSYVDFMLTALVEIPAYFACAYIVEVFGRKYTLAASYLLTGAACVGFIFIPPGSETGSLVTYLIGKFGATASFTILYVITSEMFPTPMRQSFMGICSTFGRCGSMISPQTPLLAQIWTPLPLVSFAGMSIVAGFLTFLFPETLHQKLPDTIEEAINIGKEKIDNKSTAKP